MNLKKNISKEEIATLPLCSFQGEVMIIDRVQLWNRVKEEIFSSEVLGFDTETRPTFKKGKRNSVALVQLAVAQRSYLIRINKTGWLPDFTRLLSMDEILKIGVGLRDDIRELKMVHSFNEQGFLDLQQFVQAFGIEDASLQKIVAIVLGCRISKSQQLSNWEAEVLSEKQIRYAATDAWAAFMVYQNLHQIVLKDER